MRRVAAFLSVFVLGLSPVLADKGGRHHDDREIVERAREAGKALPLSELLERIKAQGWTGKVLDVELEDEHDILIYEIYLLGPDGRRQEIKVDPATGRVLDADD